MNVANKLIARIGSSVAVDADVAGREAAAGAIAGLAEEAPALVIVYASVAYDLPVLLASIRRVTGTAPLIGATTAGQLHDGIFVAPGRGVQVLALTAGPYSFGVAGRDGLAVGDPEDLGRRLAAAARAAADSGTRPHAAVMLLSDGMAGHQQHLLNGVYEVAGAAVVPAVAVPPSFAVMTSVSWAVVAPATFVAVKAAAARREGEELSGGALPRDPPDASDGASHDTARTPLPAGRPKGRPSGC